MAAKCKKSRELLAKLKNEGCMINFNDDSKIVFISDGARI